MFRSFDQETGRSRRSSHGRAGRQAWSYIRQPATGSPRSCTVSAFLILALPLLCACEPLTIAGLVGTTVSNVMERKMSEPKLDPREIADANIKLGYEYMNRGEFDKAESKLKTARKAEADYAPVYNALGLLYQRMDQPREAEYNFRRAMHIDGNDSTVYNNYGQFLCRRRRMDEAEEYFNKAATNPLYETPEIPYTNAGLCAYRNREVDKAAEYFEKALRINPAMPRALINLAEIYFERRQYKAAHDFLDGYARISRHTARSLWLGIRIENELGNKDAVSSYALLLRNEFNGTREAALLKESGIR